MTSRTQLVLPPQRHRVDGASPSSSGLNSRNVGYSTSKPASTNYISGYPSSNASSVSAVLGRKPGTPASSASGIRISLKGSAVQPVENRIDAVLNQHKTAPPKPITPNSDMSGQMILNAGNQNSTPISPFVSPTMPQNNAGIESTGGSHSIFSPVPPERQYHFSARSAKASDSGGMSPPHYISSGREKPLYVKEKEPSSKGPEEDVSSLPKLFRQLEEDVSALPKQQQQQQRSSGNSSSCDELYSKLEASQSSGEQEEVQPHLSKIRATVVAEISRLSRLIDKGDVDKDQLRELQEMRENAAELLEQVDGEAHQVSEELLQFKRERDAAQGERETAELQSEVLKKQRDDLQDRLRATQADMESLKRAVTKAEEERDLHVRELMMVNQKKHELELKMRQTSLNKSDLEDKSVRLERVKEMLHDLEADKQRLSAMVQEERRDRADLIEQLTRLEDWKTHLQQENTKLQGFADQVVVAENALETMDAQKKHFEDIAQGHLKELEQLKLCLDQMSKDNADLSKKLELAETERDELKKLVATLDSTNKVQKDTISRVERQRDELAQKAEHAFRRAAAANLEKEKADQALVKTKEELQKAKEENHALRHRIDGFAEGYKRSDFSRTLDGWLSRLQEANQDLSVLIDEKNGDPLNASNITLLLPEAVAETQQRPPEGNKDAAKAESKVRLKEVSQAKETFKPAARIYARP